MPELLIVIVFHSDRDALARALASLDADRSAPHDTIVVDHGEEAGLDARLAGEFPTVRVLRPPGNRGFGAGVNVAWRSSDAAVVALLNPDAVVARGWAAAVLQTARERGGAACRILTDEGADDRTDSLGLHLGRDGMVHRRGHGLAPDGVAAQPLLGPAGAAAAYRRDLLESLGGFPEDYFLYYEEAEVALRARAHGFDFGTVNEPLVRHANVRAARRERRRYLQRNRLLFVARNWPASRLLRDSWLFAARDLAAGAGAILSGDASAAARARVEVLLRMPGVRAWRREHPPVAPALLDRLTVAPAPLSELAGRLLRP